MRYEAGASFDRSIEAFRIGKNLTSSKALMRDVSGTKLEPSGIAVGRAQNGWVTWGGGHAWRCFAVKGTPGSGPEVFSRTCEGTS